MSEQDIIEKINTLEKVAGTHTTIIIYLNFQLTCKEAEQRAYRDEILAFRKMLPVGHPQAIK